MNHAEHEYSCAVLHDQWEAAYATRRRPQPDLMPATERPVQWHGAIFMHEEQQRLFHRSILPSKQSSILEASIESVDTLGTCADVAGGLTECSSIALLAHICRYAVNGRRKQRYIRTRYEGPQRASNYLRSFGAPSLGCDLLQGQPLLGHDARAIKGQHLITCRTSYPKHRPACASQHGTSIGVRRTAVC